MEGETVMKDQLGPLSPQVIAKQATINIGTIGHVAHGKSTLVQAISSVQTFRFKKEFVNNITIKLGYANAKIFKCPSCPRPGCYKSFGSEVFNPFCENCGKEMSLERHISFVDCPGHEVLMATMLNGASVMDAALLLVAANQPCPQPQTAEHLAAIEIMKLEEVLILQNKVDLVSQKVAGENHEQILKFVKGTVAEEAPIIPISAQLQLNIDVVCEHIVKKIPIPQRDFTSAPRLVIVRSFDVNKPGSEFLKMKGGIAGGSLSRGVLRVGDKIEVRPGVVSKGEDGKLRCQPILSRVISLFSEQNDLEFAVPGGLIGVGTKIDPALCKGDKLVGQILGPVGSLPPIFSELIVKCFLLRQMIGLKSEENKQEKVQKIAKGEILMVTIGSTSVGGKVGWVTADRFQIILTFPACTEIGEKITLSRRIDKKWRLIGWAEIKEGIKAEVEFT